MFIYGYSKTVTHIQCLVLVTKVSKREGKIREFIKHDSDEGGGKMV